MPKGVGQSNMSKEWEVVLKTVAVNESDDVILAVQAREPLQHSIGLVPLRAFATVMSPGPFAIGIRA